MKLWLRKVSVVLVAIMTLGIYIPSTDITSDAESKGATVSSEAAVTQTVLAQTEVAEASFEDAVYEEVDQTTVLTEKAKEQALIKLGPRIASQVEDEFRAVILPKIEEELELMFAEAGEDKLAYYDITENPAKGYGERIFNVYDYEKKQVIAKFHVRRDHRPLEGHWFNFHYHLRTDGFETHHEIGDVYWDKNMPPKWMS